MSAIFVFTTKTTQPRPQVLSVNGALTRKNPQEGCSFDVIDSLNAKFFQIWSSVAGYGELCVSFKPIRMGKYFEWMISAIKRSFVFDPWSIKNRIK